MDSPTFGVHAAVAGGDLPAEWQALIASQASTLAALVSRMQTAVVTLRQREAPAARLQALAAEAERVLTAQSQEQVNVAQDGCNELDPRRRWRLPAVGGEGRMGLGDQHPSRDLSREGRHRRGLGTGDTPSVRA